MAADETMAEIIRDEVVKALVKSDAPLGFGEILAQCPSVVENQQLSNALYALKIAGKIVSPSRGLYQIASAAIENTAPRGPKETAPAKPAAPKKKAGASKVTPVPHPARRILQRLVAEAQAALDDYLYSVGDPKIIEPLRQARDNARQALAATEE